MQKTMASMNYFDFNWQNLDYFLKWNKYVDIKFTAHNADAFGSLLNKFDVESSVQVEMILLTFADFRVILPRT
jgi:hypothetical protein